MSSVDSLMQRVDAEFNAVKKRIEEFQHTKLEEYQDHQKRLDTFSRVCEELSSIWHPRLEALAHRFGDKVQVTPSVTPSSRRATFHFHSPFAGINLSFSATTDSEVRQLVLSYDLEILPILMKFKNSDQLEMPLEQIDQAAVGNWINDRIVDFVRVYLELQQNEQYLGYLKDYTVQDPIAGTRFPKYAAAVNYEWNGTTYYFLSPVTLEAFKKKNGIAD